MTQLQPRDKVIAHLLAEHRTLTTQQITDILFPSQAACRQRLYTLRRRGFIDCFTPQRPGHPNRTHWVPGPLSALFVAYAQHQPAPSPRALQERQGTLAASTHLHHLDGANQFFIDLITCSRHNPLTRLRRWWSAARTASALGRRVHPDGHGVWRDGGREVGFFLEHDTGTEPLTVLLDKVRAYRALHRDGGPDYPVLFWLPTRAREANLHERLKTVRRNSLTIATATRDKTPTPLTGLTAPGPAGPVWRLARNGRGSNGHGRDEDERRHLAELPANPGAPGPYHPGPPRPDDDPLHLLGELKP